MFARSQFLCIFYFNDVFYYLGINVFLDGFVPTENLRFRETSLVFKVSESAMEEEIKRICRYEYPKMTKQLGKLETRWPKYM